MSVQTDREPRRIVTDAYTTNNSALAAHLVLIGHPILRVTPHRRYDDRVIWLFGPEARAVAEAWYETRNRLQQEAARTLRDWPLR